MKELKEILTVLNSPHLDKPFVLESQDFEANSLQARLIDGIINSKYENDQDAAQDLYGKIYDKHRFELLKSKLKQRASASLLLYEIKDKEASPREAMRVHLQRQIVAANLLLLFGARPTGVKLLKKIIALSSQYMLNDCSVFALSLMQSHYWFCGNIVMHKETAKMLRENIALLDAELRSEELYQSITLPHVLSTSNNPVPINKLKDVLERLLILKKHENNSYIIKVNNYKLRVVYYQLMHQYNNVSKECEKALAYFSHDKILRNDPLAIYFLINQCESFFLNNEPQKMFVCLDKLRKLIGEKSTNRAIIERKAFYANVYSGKFLEAEKLLELVESKTVPVFPHQQIEWRLFRAYIEVIKYAENVIDKGAKHSPSLHSIKLPPLSKDKHGSNISILIYETLCSILLKDYTKLLKLDKKLDNYIYRYLSNDGNNDRSVIFLKMLRIVIKEDFDLKKIEKKSNQLVTKLRLNTSRSFVEIVPYQELWSLLLQSFT